MKEYGIYDVDEFYEDLKNKPLTVKYRTWKMYYDTELQRQAEKEVLDKFISKSGYYYYVNPITINDSHKIESAILEAYSGPTIFGYTFYIKDKPLPHEYFTSFEEALIAMIAYKNGGDMRGLDYIFRALNINKK